MKRILLITSLVIALVVSSGLQSPLQAAESAQGLVVTPPTFELTANPGDTLKNSIRIDNITDSPLKVTTDLRNFTALGEEGQVGLTEEESAFSLASWINVEPPVSMIPPKGSHTFHFIIQVPVNAEPGGRFGSIVFKTDTQPVNGSGLSVGQEVGTLLMLRLAGKVTERASIKDFKTLKSFSEYGPVNFGMRVKNEGNVHIKPTGTITITDFFGRKAATLPVNSKNVLPDAVRKLEGKWSKTSLFGKYTATLSLNYGTTQQTITASTTFVVIPYRLLLVWLGVLAVAGTLVYLGRRRIGRSLRILIGKE